MDDKGGSNLLSASQYSRISHNVAVENINIYVKHQHVVGKQLPSGRNLAVSLSPEANRRAIVTFE